MTLFFCRLEIGCWSLKMFPISVMGLKIASVTSAGNFQNVNIYVLFINVFNGT